MKIKYHRRFTKRYQKLLPHVQSKVRAAISHFVKNPHDPRLRNHALTGQLKGLRAFSVTGDICIIFEERDNYTFVILLDVGPHARVYK